MRKTLYLTLLLAVAASGWGAVVAAAEGGAVRIPSVTRLVRIFSGLEGDLVTALARRDVKAVAKLLGDDFEMRVGASPGTPIPRAAWIRQSLAEPQSSSAMEQMAVHDYGEFAVVSFLWKTKAEKAEAGRGIFIVDVWTGGPDDWRLAVRYAGPAEGGNSSSIPGAVPTVPAFEKRE